MPAVEAAAPSAVQERLASRMEAIVAKRIAGDQLVLPAIPTVAAKAVALIREPELSLKAAAALIERDPTMAAQLLKLAGGAGPGAREPVHTVLAAVTRLGASKVRNFLSETSARKLFESRDPAIAEAFKGMWEHALAVALLARDVVAFSNSGDPDLGYLAGLLHDIGKPVVAALLLETERSVLSAKAHAAWISGVEWIGVIQRCHQRLGVMLAEKWELPEPIVRSIRDCTEYDNTDRLSVANAVRFANALAKQQGLYVGTASMDDADALVMIGRSLLDIDEDLVTRLTAGIKPLVKDTARGAAPGE